MFNLKRLILSKEKSDIVISMTQLSHQEFFPEQERESEIRS